MSRTDLWTKDEDALAIRLAEEGHTLAQIAAKIGRSRDGVRNRLKRHLRPDITVSVYPRDPSIVRTAAPWQEHEDLTVMRILREGGTIIDAGLIVKRSPEAVRKRLKALRSALVPSTRSAILARDKPVPAGQVRAAKKQERRLLEGDTRACRLHLIDLMRSFGASTLGEAKSHYVNRCEYKPQAGTPVYMPVPVWALSYVGSTAAMCSGD